MSHKKLQNADTDIGKMISFAYFCKPSLQLDFIDAYLHCNFDNRIILIIHQFPDVSPVATTAITYLHQLQRTNKIVSIFVTSIATSYRFAHYYNLIESLYVYPSKMRNDKSITDKKYKNARLRDCPHALREYIITLREGSEPVLFSDLSEVTGINKSSLQRIVNERAAGTERYARGRHISQNEREHINKLLVQNYNEIMKQIHIYPDENETLYKVNSNPM